MRAITAAKKIQNKETVFEAIKEYCEVIPFNFDYASLNWLAYLQQEELRLNLLLNSSVNDKQKEEIQSRLRDIRHNREKNQENFSAIISDHLEITAKITALTAQQIESRKVIDDDTASNLAVDMSVSQYEEADKELATIREIIPEIASLRKPSEWQKLMFTEFLKQNDATATTDFLVLRAQFILFLLENNAAHFPEKYQPDAAANTKFPSSNKNTTGLGHLDIQGRKKILAISAPMKSGAAFLAQRVEQDQETLNNFKNTLIENNIKTVICLGTLKKHPKRLDYRTMLAENKITFVEIDVDDNKSLNLSNNQLRTIISAFAKQDEMDAVHCDSGVGRTGQLRLLLALLSKFKSSDLFSTACNWMLSLFLDLKNSDDQTPKVDVKKLADYLLKTISETLTELRQTRYCIQTEEQFSNTLAQLLLLIAAQKNYTNEQLNSLRESFDLPAPIDDLSVSDNVASDSENSDDEEPVAFDDDTDSLVSTEGRSRVVPSPKLFPERIPTPPASVKNETQFAFRRSN